MLDPYKMVFVNIIGSLLILFGTLFYRFIYPKKKINLFCINIYIKIPLKIIFENRKTFKELMKLSPKKWNSEIK